MKLATLVSMTLLAGCVDAAAPPADRQLRIATWNLEHLAERDGEGCRPRTEADYAELRRHAGASSVDHIALDRRAGASAAPGSFAEYRYGLPGDRHPSDHCPVSVAFSPARRG